jgi:endoglucanase
MNRLIAASVALALSSLTLQAGAADVDEIQKRMGDGINLGNALEAPKEGDWGVTLEESYFEAIAKAGFGHVRIPVRWSAHAQVEAPYTIDPEFLNRVDWAVDQALSRGLVAVVNIHHFAGMDDAPDENEPMLQALWSQIAEHFKDRPETLVFELLNEPHGKLTDERWNRIIPGLLATIRKTNPGRAVIVGPGGWNSLDHLAKLELPATDRHLIVTFHYYNPFHFTHQNAEWVEGSASWKDTSWTGTPEQIEAIARDFDAAAAWGRKHDRPLYLGEFGAYSKAPLPERVQWTEAIVKAARSRHFSLAYWEFCSGFGAYDPAAHHWREPLLKALDPKK